jgi:hypothetical protein
MHAKMWFDRLEGEPQFQEALEELRPIVDQRGEHLPEFEQLWAEMTEVRRSQPAGDVVNREQVWEALAEIPDPEIPVISIVDLGVVRDVAVENGTCTSSSRRPSSAARRSR